MHDVRLELVEGFRHSCMVQTHVSTTASWMDSVVRLGKHGFEISSRAHKLNNSLGGLPGIRFKHALLSMVLCVHSPCRPMTEAHKAHLRLLRHF